MTRTSIFTFSAAFICSALGLGAFHSPSVRAAGLLIADGGFGGQLEIEEHNVQVTINNGVAVTEVTQVFRNLENRQVEALYTFPVPKNASVSNFSMWIAGKEMVGEVVEKKRAREIYESYKRRRIDPGLLEQVDYKRFEMRIFPINPRAEQKVKVTYYQELDADHNWVTYTYPLATVTREDVDARTQGTFAFTLDAKSGIPIAAMESPSHAADFVVANHREDYYQASLETKGGDLNRDVVVAYKLERPRTGFDLVASNPPDEDGYFCLQLTAGEDVENVDHGMDYVFVLDISGSMSNSGKLRLSRRSIGAFIDAIGPEDRFEVITFNVQPNTLFRQLSAVSDETKARAQDFLASREARGGTVLNPAIKLAYSYGDPDRPLNVVVLSDGMTQPKERSALHRLIRERPANARVFCVGVGNEVNRPLLRQVAEEAGGLASFISHGDNFERQAKAFRRKLTHPVARNVQIAIDGVSVYDVEPKILPNLYHGTPVRLYGRYRKGGTAKVVLSADVAGREVENKVEIEFPAIDASNPEIERMWAWRVVDRLMKEKNAGGASAPLVDEIVRLGELYSIVTEHTSFLVLENDAAYRRWQIERRNLRRLKRDRKARLELAAKLEAIRTKVATGLGPQGVELASAAPRVVPAEGRSTPAASTPRQANPRQANPRPANPPPSRPTRSRGIDIDFGGSGPVGPLFVGLSLWLARRRRRAR